MFRTLTLSGVAATGQRTVELDPKAATHIAAPSASGKSTLTHALLVLLCGIQPNRMTMTKATQREAEIAEITGTTQKGTILSVRATKSATRWSRDGVAMANRDAYLATLGRYGGPDVRFIVAPMAWRELAAGTAQPLRDLLSRILPAGDIPARVRELLADDWRETDPSDVRNALALQTESNSARDRADGALQTRRDALSRAQAARQALQVPSPHDVERAHQTKEAEEAWRRFDVDGRAWRDFAAQHEQWMARAPGVEPEYDGAAHQAARISVQNLTEQLAKESAAFAAERARAEAEERAAAREEKARQDATMAERDRVRREASAKARADLEARDKIAAEIKQTADQIRPLMFPTAVTDVCATCGQAIPKKSEAA